MLNGNNSVRPRYPGFRRGAEGSEIMIGVEAFMQYVYC